MDGAPMKRTVMMLVLCALSAATLSLGQTQGQMNGQAADEFRAADKELNSIYQKIITDYVDDEVFVASLKEAQRCWVAFRDAQLRMKYPDRGPGYYGSIQPVCEANYLTELTRERTAALKVWLAGVEEGNVCAGTVKAKGAAPRGNATP
jgi:uncharacterized protein YecT (DUF1311 family)